MNSSLQAFFACYASFVIFSIFHGIGRHIADVPFEDVVVALKVSGTAQLLCQESFSRPNQSGSSTY